MGRRFTNQIPTSMAMDMRTTLGLLRDAISGNPRRRPATPLPAVRNAADAPRHGEARITWFGHSAILLEIAGKRLLIDPMFGNAPSPVPIFGTKRYRTVAPVELGALPPVDAVLLSHDHYDHLDYQSIRSLKDKVNRFIVPLGVGSHLERWGVDPAKIAEHKWWDEFQLEGLTLACTPARHFSGRGLFNRNATLWCSWVIISEKQKVFFSGDSGYAPHFKEIGDAYGPFDLTLLECGQYDRRWPAIHMVPEETVQANVDLKGKVMMPIHWAAFTLAFHAWTDPIERVTKAAQERGVRIATPMIGETVVIGSDQYPQTAWWRQV